jgi:hypothetical protein
MDFNKKFFFTCRGTQASFSVIFILAIASGLLISETHDICHNLADVFFAKIIRKITQNGENGKSTENARKSVHQSTICASLDEDKNDIL